MTESPEAAPVPRRAIAIVLGVLAAAALGVAAFSPHWLGNAVIFDEAQVTMGLRSFEKCSDGGVICVRVLGARGRQSGKN